MKLEFASPKPVPVQDARNGRPQPRLEQLFRHSLRQGSINPLLYCIRQYRGEEGRP